MRWWRPRLLAAVVLAAGALALAPAGVAAADEVFVVYLDPAGSDANDGLTPATGVKTLQGAQDILTAAAPQTDVEVRIKQGTYVAPTTTWRFYVAGHTISFMPIDYEYGEKVDGIAGRPLFRSNGTAGYWFSAKLPDGHPGGDTNLRFYYLQVERYSTGGLELNGGTVTNSLGVWVPRTAGVNHNSTYGMVFQNLGSKYSSAGFAYGAIDMVNSSDNLIQNSHFLHVENTGESIELVHALYVAHWSKRNVITANRFYYVSGAPVRMRNDSNDNDIYANTFERAGPISYYSEWFCDTACAIRDDHARECASHGNVFHDNNTITGYSGRDISWWGLSPGDNDYAGGAGCTNEGQKRIRTYGNT